MGRGSAPRGSLERPTRHDDHPINGLMTIPYHKGPTMAGLMTIPLGQANAYQFKADPGGDVHKRKAYQTCRWLGRQISGCLSKQGHPRKARRIHLLSVYRRFERGIVKTPTSLSPSASAQRPAVASSVWLLGSRWDEKAPISAIAGSPHIESSSTIVIWSDPGSRANRELRWLRPPSLSPSAIAAASSASLRSWPCRPRLVQGLSVLRPLRDWVGSCRF